MTTLASFGAVKRAALARAVPLGAHLELTYKCNWDCVFCYNPRRHDQAPLAFEEWTQVMDDLRTLGTLTLTLTGGEALTHPRFGDLARAARSRHFALRVFTNGALVTEKRADELAALGLFALEMSLHGSQAEVHDRATGRPGSFAAMWQGIERMGRRGVKVTLKTPLTHLNEDDLDAMIALAAEHGLSLRVDPTITPRDDGDRSPLQYRASAAGIERMMRTLARHGQMPELAERSEGGTNCGLGRLTVAIDPEGNVYPCLQWKKTSLGNVRRTRLVDLWSGPERAAAAQVASDANDMLVRRGGAEATFPFCPALAFQETGDPLTPDPLFRIKAEAAARVRAENGGAKPAPVTGVSLV